MGDKVYILTRHLLHSQTMDPRNKSISQIKMCMCGEWMVYGDDGNGDSLILVLLFWGDTYLSCSLKLLRRMRCSIFSFSYLSGGYLVPLILLSNTCPFYLSSHFFFSFEVPGTCPFLFPRIFIYIYIWEHSSPEIVKQVVITKITWAFISQGK